MMAVLGRTVVSEVSRRVGGRRSRWQTNPDLPPDACYAAFTRPAHIDHTWRGMYMQVTSPEYEMGAKPICVSWLSSARHVRHVT